MRRCEQASGSDGMARVDTIAFDAHRRVLDRFDSFRADPDREPTFGLRIHGRLIFAPGRGVWSHVEAVEYPLERGT